METREKTAIILIGGGMRSAHGAGFLYALGSQTSLSKPDLMIASSGNAAGALYFVAGQYESIKRIWTQLLSTRRFIFFLRFWKIMDIDYLVDAVFKMQEPLDIAAVQRTTIDWLIPITDARTGFVRYVGKKDNVNIFELLRAAKAIVLFYGRKVTIWGKKYIDGELGPTTLDHVRTALSHGANRIVLIDDSSERTASDDIALQVYSHFVASGLGEAIRRDIASHAVCVVAPGATVLCIRPALRLGALTRSKVRLSAAFECGVADVLALESELRTLLNV